MVVASQPGKPTRQRILDAAISRFASHSYEDAKLRDIAADVGVDVAYVHRCFGSKANLFAEAIKATGQTDRWLDEPPQRLAEALTRSIFARDGAPSRGEIRPLDIVIRSLTSPEATGVLRELILADVVEPLAGKLGQSGRQKAALIVAFLAGIGILRTVLGVEPLVEADGDELEALIADAFRRLTKIEAAG